MQQIAVTVRRLARQPSTSLLVVAMLAVGIAGTSAMFSLVHSLVLAPLDFADADQLVYLNETAPKWNLENTGISHADFHAWRESNRTFESMALANERSFALMGHGGAERIRGAEVTYDLLDVLRVQPFLGRGFTPEEDRDGGPKVAILSHGFWQDRFGGRKDVLGTTLKLNGDLHEIVGVLPPALRYPEDAQLWVPVALDPEKSFGSYRFDGIGRLLPGVTIARAVEDLDATLAPLHEKYPWKADATSWVMPLREYYTKDSRTVAWALLAAVALVLLIACANVAGLMLARSASRQREISVRLALGAGHGQVVRQLLAESLVLGVAGGVLGLVLGHLGLHTLGQLVADEMPFWVTFAPDVRALATCFAVSLVTVLAFGLVPAIRTVRGTSRHDLQSALRGSAARSGAGRGERRTLQTVVVAEMALAQMLLVGAALVALSQRAVLDVDPGYRTENVLQASVQLPESSYPDDAARFAFFRTLQERLATVPGVETAALTTSAPLRGHNGTFFEAEGVPRNEDGQQPVILQRMVSEEILEALGIPLLSGRAPQVRGVGEDAALEVVVNETFARLYWGDADPLGRRVRKGEEAPWMTVVGVAADTRHYGPDKDVRPGVYVPMGFGYMWPFMDVVLHTRGTLEPTSLLPEVRRVLRELDPELPVFQVATTEEELHDALTMRRLTAWLFSLFAGVALLLAAGGAYGVLSYSVHQRRREIGVRIAVGARAGQVLADVLRRGMALAAGGALLGVLGAASLSSSLTALLYNVEARNPAVFATVAAVLAAVALAANAFPALRAARTDAMRVLREE